MWLSTEVQSGGFIAVIMFWASVAWLLIMTPVAVSVEYQSAFRGMKMKFLGWLFLIRVIVLLAMAVLGGIFIFSFLSAVGAQGDESPPSEVGDNTELEVYRAAIFVNVAAEGFASAIYSYRADTAHFCNLLHDTRNCPGPLSVANLQNGSIVGALVGGACTNDGDTEANRLECLEDEYAAARIPNLEFGVGVIHFPIDQLPRSNFHLCMHQVAEMPTGTRTGTCAAASIINNQDYTTEVQKDAFVGWLPSFLTDFAQLTGREATALFVVTDNQPTVLTAAGSALIAGVFPDFHNRFDQLRGLEITESEGIDVIPFLQDNTNVLRQPFVGFAASLGFDDVFTFLTVFAGVVAVVVAVALYATTRHLQTAITVALIVALVPGVLAPSAIAFIFSGFAIGSFVAVRYLVQRFNN